MLVREYVHIWISRSFDFSYLQRHFILNHPREALKFEVVTLPTLYDPTRRWSSEIEDQARSGASAGRELEVDFELSATHKYEGIKQGYRLPFVMRE